MIRLLPLLLCLLATVAGAAEWAGTVKAAEGTVMVERRGERTPLGTGDRVFPQDKLITGKDSRVAVTLRDDTLISSGANAQVVISEFAFNPTTQSGGIVVSVLRGVSAFVSGLVAKTSPTAMRVTTPTATLGIRGTEFIVDLDN